MYTFGPCMIDHQTNTLSNYLFDDHGVVLDQKANE
jgi:hypothetical protein